MKRLLGAVGLTLGACQKADDVATLAKATSSPAAEPRDQATGAWDLVACLRHEGISAETLDFGDGELQVEINAPDEYMYAVVEGSSASGGEWAI
ncbi:MAG: hypothetical protein LBO75_01770 [Bifidobacteriaceae bacterium]|jgi:type II secretory pathway component PulM|nr:hypothetical protein [Bifidobacteriaceae bacterium]